MWTTKKGPDLLIIHYLPWGWMIVALLCWIGVFAVFAWGNTTTTLDCSREAPAHAECLYEHRNLLTATRVEFSSDELRRAEYVENAFLFRDRIVIEGGDALERLEIPSENNDAHRAHMRDIERFVDGEQGRLSIEVSNLAGALFLVICSLLPTALFTLAASKICTCRVDRARRAVEIRRHSLWGSADVDLYDLDDIEAIELNPHTSLHGFDEDLDIPFREVRRLGMPLSIRLKNGEEVFLTHRQPRD